MITASSVIISEAAGGSGSGGGGTPGGSPTEIQFNNTVFGGIPGSAVDPATGAITLAPIADATGLTITQFGTAPGLAVTDTGGAENFELGCSVSGIFMSGFADSGATSFGFGVIPGTQAQFFLTDLGGGNITLVTGAAGPGLTSFTMSDVTPATLSLSPSAIGFFSATAVGQQTVTGMKLPSDTVMASLLAALVAYGLIIDSTT